MIFFSVCIALLLDKVLGEPRVHHPLIYFGKLAAKVEFFLNIDLKKDRDIFKKIRGVVAWICVVVPLVVSVKYLMGFLEEMEIVAFLISVIILYIAIGWQSLLSHAQAVIEPLQSGDLDRARECVGYIVSRDSQSLTRNGVARAAIESVLENGADAIFSAIFWFCLFGAPGVVLYRLSNTLDAMWGYKNQRFLHFGWCAARIDDVLNYIPARLTALSYALVGDCAQALYCWKTQTDEAKSPNAGLVMASGAGAINVTLGGDASYHGVTESKPILGPEESLDTQACDESITKACALINRSLILWLLIIGYIYL